MEKRSLTTGSLSQGLSIILLSWFIHWSFNYLTLYHLLNGLQCIFHEDTDLMALSPVLNTVAGTEYSSNIYLSNACHWLCWNKLKACPLYADWHDCLSPEMSAPLSLMNLLASFLIVPFSPHFIWPFCTFWQPKHMFFVFPITILFLLAIPTITSKYRPTFQYFQ